MSDGSASRVAVIAIHGVGDHLPEEMAKAAGGMLESRQTPAGDSRYEAFRENPIRVKTGGVKLRPEHSGAWHGKRAWGPLDELRMSGTPAAAAAVAQKDSIDHLFMEGQLSGYEGQGPEDTCEFLRLEGVRKAQPGIAEKLVHVHDMFWSDLSGVGQKGAQSLWRTLPASVSPGKRGGE